MVVSNIFYFHQYLGEMIQFDDIIFFKRVGSTKPPTSHLLCVLTTFSEKFTVAPWVVLPPHPKFGKPFFGEASTWMMY